MGVAVGDEVGSEAEVGSTVGEAVGWADGDAVGFTVGAAEGKAVDGALGTKVGDEVGGAEKKRKRVLREGLAVRHNAVPDGSATFRRATYVRDWIHALILSRRRLRMMPRVPVGEAEGAAVEGAVGGASNKSALTTNETTLT